MSNCPQPQHLDPVFRRQSIAGAAAGIRGSLARIPVWDTASDRRRPADPADGPPPLRLACFVVCFS